MSTFALETELELAHSGDQRGPMGDESRPTRFWHYVVGIAAALFVLPAVLMLLFYWIPALIALLPVFQLDRVEPSTKVLRHVAVQPERGWAHPR